MKLKYYLRGLGIGILITGLIMGISQKNAVASARAEVMRAYAQDALKDEPSESFPVKEQESEPVLVRGEEETPDNKNPEVNWQDVNGENKDPENPDGESPQENIPQEEGPEPASVPEADMPDPSTVSEKEESSEAVVIVNPGAAALDAQTVTITISRGDDSGTVSRKLYNAGLIESASEYDAFLMQHGYDKRINTGEKVIGLNDSWQEIAEKITHSSP